MLEIFMLQVVKWNGLMFPPQSLQDIFRRFGVIIRREQERQVAESGVKKVPFNIKQSVLFTKARLACVAAMRRSRRTAGVCMKRKKADEISFVNEQALLADVDHGIHHSVGVQKRILFCLMSRFGIRGQDELAGLKVTDFHVGSENGREFVEYSERLSKQYVDMNRYQEEQFRMPLRVYEEDVIVTFKQFLRHYPITDSDENWFFKQAIISPHKTAWFNVKHRVSGRKLSLWLKYMLALIGVEGAFSGKSGRTSMVSRMSRSGVPYAIGMKATGHRSESGYKRYDKSEELQVKAALDIVGKPFNNDGSRRMFQDVYKEKLDDYDRIQNVATAPNLLAPDSGSSSVLASASALGALKDVQNAGPIVATDFQNVGAVGKQLAGLSDKQLEDDAFLNEIRKFLEKQCMSQRVQMNSNNGIGNILGGKFHKCVIHIHSK